MLAAVRQVAYGLATVMAGFWVVALAGFIWAALFRADDLVPFTGYEPPRVFDFGEPPWMVGHSFAYYEAFIGVGVVMWLIGYAIRWVAKPTSSVLRR